MPGHDGVVSSLTIEENAMRADAPPLALIEVMDPDAADADMLTGDAGVAATSVSDDRFAVILDPENGLWLHLAEGASLDHEAGAEVMVTVTYTDSAGNTADATVTVMVTDVNEAPMAVGEVGNVPAEAGKALSHEVDLMALFSDPDGGDSIESWTLSGGPDWLELVTRQDDDGMTGILQGTPPTTGAGSAAEHMVTITATDSGGETASLSFYVVVDDGNDRPTGINLIDDGQSVVEVEVTEGDAGVVLGEIRVEDIDSPQHPYGQHLITVSDDRFEIREEDGRKWLALKEGESLDRERESGEVLVTLRAIDRNGEKDEDGDYEGHRSDPVTFAVVINDVNDAPRAGAIGNWWVTVNEGLEREDVGDGDWLSFYLETAGDRFPAFTDQDLNAGDELTYSISMNRGNWLQIDEETGQITNIEGAIPTRGVYRVTVTATDEDGQSASKSFNLNVALSRAADDGTLTVDNSAPYIPRPTELDYREGSGDQRVADFRVTDEDQDIPDHQFALKEVKIVAITSNISGDPYNVMLRDHDGDDADNDGLIDSGANAGQPATPLGLYTAAATAANPAKGYAGAFELSDPIKSGNSWIYHIEAVDTDPNPYSSTLTGLLNHERVAGRFEITIKVAAIDGTESTVLELAADGSVTTDSDGIVAVNENAATDDIRIEILDEDEAPAAPRASSAATALVQNSDLQVDQAADNVKLLYIKLEDLWTDDRDSDARLEFGASRSGSWVDIWRRPADWSDIAPGRDGDAADAADNVPWPGSGTTVTFDGTDYDFAIIGDNDDEPGTGTEPDQMVVIVAIDRTERNNQGDEASFTLTATDNNGRGKQGERTYDITVVDQNVDVDEGAVTLTGSARQGSRLTANFNDNRDPDLAGSATPALVLYTWFRVTDDGSDPDDLSDDTVVVISQGTSNTYSPTQSDVDSKIRVIANYYDVPITERTNDDAASRAQLVGTAFNDGSPATPTGLDEPLNVATTSRVVSNTPDRGAADITILANSDALTVSTDGLRIVDGDYDFNANAAARLVSDPSADADGDPDPANPIVSFEVSLNGRGGWTPVDDDDVSFDSTTNTTSLSLDDDAEGKYYRAVVNYNADTGANSAKERVVSDPIQVSDLRDATGAPPLAAVTITGSPNPGGTLHVDVNANVTVQWQIREDAGASGTYDWVDIPGATGSLRLTQAHAGENVRAVVSYQSRDPDSPGVTAVVATPTQAIAGTPSNVRPVQVDDYEIEASVGGTGHGFLVISPAGHNAAIEHTVPLGSLFQDPDTPNVLISYVAEASQTDPNLGANTGAAGSTTYVYEHAGGVLIFEAKSGKLTYLSDQYRGHDGNPDTDGDGSPDGDGNTITLEVRADDIPGPDGLTTGGNTGGAADIVLRINVAPTGITFRADEADNTNDANNAELGTANFFTAYGIRALPQITITENDFEGGTQYKGPGDPDQAPLAILDVQDENLSGSAAVRGHKFGVHEITVSGDDRFVVSKTGGDDPNRDLDSDGSTWELHAVKGATFDYETDDMDGNPRNGIQIVLTLTATDGGGLSTPTPNTPNWLYELGASTGVLATPGPASTDPTAFTAANFHALVHLPIQLLVTIANADQADEKDPQRPRGPETPGLKDDASDNDSNDETDGADDDTDGGGGAPPPPGMSLGGIIEDFIDNMDQGEQDLLDDYLLTIDDGLDIL
ncbi:MAG: hypothetical protein F4Y00_11230 [Bacteroidetes bacterium SB0662_bin_6]|nr:hypothetical protein [Bacteroidetes bacterium SB0662_bin_6]